MSDDNIDGDIEMDPGKDPIDPTEQCSGSTDLDEGSTCAICFEPYTSAGEHRLICLRCGHLFGLSCIKRHLEHTKKKGKCPSCRMPASIKDLRKLYAKAVQMEDNSEVVRLADELTKAKDTRRGLEYDLAVERKRTHDFINENKMLQAKLAKYEILDPLEACATVSGTSLAASKGFDPSIFSTGGTQPSMPGRVAFMPGTKWEIDSNESCRVMAFCPTNGLLAVSCQAPPTCPFKGHGVKLVNLNGSGNARYIPIHSKCVRDMSFSECGNGHLLSVGMDASLHITKPSTSAKIWSGIVPYAGWSCCFGPDSRVIVGCGNGRVYMIDTQDDDKTVTEVTDESSSRNPVCAVHYIHCTQNDIRGIVAAKGKEVIFFQMQHDLFLPHILNKVEGTITSLAHIGKDTHQFLLSARPTQPGPPVIHQLVQFEKVNDRLMNTQIHTFSASRSQQRMTRNSIFEYLPHSSMALIFHEEQRKICVYDCATGEEKGNVKVRSETMQVMQVVHKNKMGLAVLDPTNVQVFEFRV